jgi:hypothetical protein
MKEMTRSERATGANSQKDSSARRLHASTFFVLLVSDIEIRGILRGDLAALAQRRERKKQREKEQGWNS